MYVSFYVDVNFHGLFIFKFWREGIELGLVGFFVCADASFKEKLPGQIRAPAVFKCVRVTSVDDGQDEYAYQAVVKIGGHVFKGFLYDQGHENRDVYPNLSELHLGGGGGGGNNGNGGSGSGGSGAGGGGRNGVSSSSPMLDPSDVYAASGGGFLGGSAYGNPIN